VELIIEQKIVREHPIGLVAKRTIGYERSNEDGKGLEYAFRDYLNGKNGHRMMQKIAKNQWKPISDINEKILKMVMILFQRLMFTFKILRITLY
jgi:cell division protein FtsI (penicillin-binding protein 3)